LIPRRALGRHGDTLPVLGFGVSGPHAGGWTRRGHTIRLIRRAAELGVSLFDTAPFYGDGEAERRLGAALAGLERDALFISTKTGTYRRDGDWAKDFSPDAVSAQLEASLERLGVGHVDALFLHGPSPQQLTPELIETLGELKTAGKTRRLGVCGRGDEIYAAVESGAFDLLMAPCHVRLTPKEAKRITAARDAGLGLIGIEIFSPSLNGPRIPTRVSDLRALAKWARREREERGFLKPAECLKYAVASGVCDCALFTTTRLRHLEENAAAARALEHKVAAS